MKNIVTMGRGGTGKTTFVALMARSFMKQKKTPVLLVDADPDQNLAEMMGVSLEQEGVRTISELITETFIKKGGTTVGVPPSERIEMQIWERGLYEGESFDLMAVGTKWIEGCYCMPDAALHTALESLTKNYEYVLIDSPAGLEHLNRRITSQIGILFDIIGPSNKSFEHVKRAYRIAREVGISFEKFYVVGGCLFPEELEERAQEATGQEYLGKVTFDPDVQKSVIAGHSLLNLPDDNPAARSVEGLLRKARLI